MSRGRNSPRPLAESQLLRGCENIDPKLHAVNKIGARAVVSPKQFRPGNDHDDANDTTSNGARMLGEDGGSRIEDG
jgi:hypothetical protein